MDAGEGLADWLRLTLIPGIGGETQRKRWRRRAAVNVASVAGDSSWREWR